MDTTSSGWRSLSCGMDDGVGGQGCVARGAVHERQTKHTIVRLAVQSPVGQGCKAMSIPAHLHEHDLVERLCQCSFLFIAVPMKMPTTPYPFKRTCMSTFSSSVFAAAGHSATASASRPYICSFFFSSCSYCGAGGGTGRRYGRGRRAQDGIDADRPLRLVLGPCTARRRLPLHKKPAPDPPRQHRRDTCGVLRWLALHRVRYMQTSHHRDDGSSASTAAVPAACCAGWP